MSINELILTDPENNFFFLYLIRGIICENQGFFIMEMAISDIRQKIKYSDITLEDLTNTVTDVLQSLLRLAHLRIYHGDLHIGNVFLVFRNCQIRTVIGDFGESSITDSPTASSSDLFQFINRLTVNFYREFRLW